MELQEQTPHCIEQVRSVPSFIVGWLPPEMCANTTLANVFIWWNGQRYSGTEPTDWLPAGYLWVCGHYSWPYLPADWTGHCI